MRQTVKPYPERKISKSDAPYHKTFKCVTAYSTNSSKSIPDIAIEVDVTSAGINYLEVYIYNREE